MMNGDLSMGTPGPEGVRTHISSYGLDATIARLLSTIEAHGLRLFALIDHDAAASEAGLELRPSRLAIFGSPAAGTPLMIESPLLALQLPLRILVWEGDDGRVRLSHLTIEALTAPVAVDPDRAGVLAGASALIDEALA
jgi:uncharacterized protein (DUF302 family)